MSYQSYVIAAYLVFVVVLLWDFVAPRIEVRQLLRAARLRATRQAPGKARPDPNGDAPPSPAPFPNQDPLP